MEARTPTTDPTLDRMLDEWTPRAEADRGEVPRVVRLAIRSARALHRRRTGSGVPIMEADGE